MREKETPFAFYSLNLRFLFLKSVVKLTIFHQKFNLDFSSMNFILEFRFFSTKSFILVEKELIEVNFKILMKISNLINYKDLIYII